MDTMSRLSDKVKRNNEGIKMLSSTRGGGLLPLDGKMRSKLGGVVLRSVHSDLSPVLFSHLTNQPTCLILFLPGQTIVKIP